MSADFQAILLSFFGQELVAHAATLFAALGGEFFFVDRFRPHKGARFWDRLGFSLVSGFLFALIVYAGFRMVSYGQLAGIVMTYDPRPQLDTTLSQYYAYVVDVATRKATDPIQQFAAQFRYPTNNPVVGLLEFVVWVIWVVAWMGLFYFRKPKT